MNKDIVWFDGYVTREKREKLNGHLGCAVWLTGLSASGKSSVARTLEKELYKRKHSAYVLDGDNVRHGLCGNLGFSRKDRAENIRRAGEAAKLFVDAGIIVISAFISPYKEDRKQVRGLIGASRFVEVFADCPIEVCEQRDPKGIYNKARQGVVKNFTGVDSPYEKPDNPEIHLRTETTSPQENTQLIIDYLVKRKYISDI